MKIFQFETKDLNGIATHKVTAGFMSTCSISDYSGTISIIDTLKSTAGLVEKGKYKSGDLRMGASPALGTYVETLTGANRIARLGFKIVMVPEQPDQIVVMTPP